jgi:electron transfer flavoprotein alpha subunit
MHILVVAEILAGRPGRLTLELLALARTLLPEQGDPRSGVTAVAFGAPARDCADALIAHGADSVLVEDGDGDGEFDSDLWCGTLTAITRDGAAELVLLPHTPSGTDLAPRIATRLGGALASGCTGIVGDGDGLCFTRSCFGGNVREQLRLLASPAVASVRKGACEALPFDSARRGSVSAFTAAGKCCTSVLARQRDGTGTLRLEDARVVVAGGRGVQGAEGFAALQQLADALGGAVAATRVACDLDWCPRSWQVGLTGKSVAPELYIAVGISGASHHMAGCAGAGTIVAINPDAQAPIFQYARFGITRDCAEVIPELRSAIAALGKR